jgi:hypothetical protein
MGAVPCPAFLCFFPLLFSFPLFPFRRSHEHAIAGIILLLPIAVYKGTIGYKHKSAIRVTCMSGFVALFMDYADGGKALLGAERRGRRKPSADAEMCNQCPCVSDYRMCLCLCVYIHPSVHIYVFLPCSICVSVKSACLSVIYLPLCSHH